MSRQQRRRNAREILRDIDRMVAQSSESKPLWDITLDELDARLGAVAQDNIPTYVQVFTQPSISLKEFAQGAWHIVEPSTKLEWNWHLDVICDHLEAVSRGEITHLIINIPPRCMKSLLVSVFWPAWEWTWRPAWRWMFSSYAQPLSTRDSVKMRRVITSDWYQRRWGNVFELMGDQNEKVRYENDKSGYRIATSVGGGATGEGGDAIVVDDPLKADEESSDVERENANEWYKGTMSSRGNTPDSRFVVMMQRLHERDLSGVLMEEQKDTWKTLVIPMEYEGTKTIGCLGHIDPRNAHGELLWEARFNAAKIASLKISLGSYGYAGQYQQRPAPASGGIFKQVNWRFWKPEGLHLPAWPLKDENANVHMREAIDLPKRFSELIHSWDLTFDGSVAWDVGGVWGRVGARFFLIDLDKGRWEFPEQLAGIKRLIAKHPASAKLIERAANAKAIGAVTRQNIPGIILLPVEGDKPSRARSVSAYHEAGNWFIPHPALFPWVQDYMKEHEVFPNAAFSDQVDMSSQALRYLNRYRQLQATGSAQTGSQSSLNI